MKNYYVVFDEGAWGVKLEASRYVRRNLSSFEKAKREAIRLAINNDRGLTVNAKGGYTRYSMSNSEVVKKYGNKRWTPAV